MTAESTVAVCVSVYERVKNNNVKNILMNRLVRIKKSNTFREILEDILDDAELDDSTHIALDYGQVDVSASGTKGHGATAGSMFHLNYSDYFSTAVEFDSSLKVINYHIRTDKGKGGLGIDDACTSSGDTRKQNAFDVMMSSSKSCNKLPFLIDSQKPRFTEKDRLQNDISTYMRENNIAFPNSMPDNVIQKHLGVVTNTMWYLDGNKDKIMDRSTMNIAVQPIPSLFLSNFNQYNDWKKKRKRAPQLSSDVLKDHSSALFDLVASPFTACWGNFKQDLENLALSMNSYAAYLDSSNQDQKKRQFADHPPREVDEHSWIHHIPSTTNIHPRYALLDEKLRTQDLYTYIIFDEALHLNQTFDKSIDKFYFFSKLQLSVPVDCLKYSPGGSFGTINIIWRVPEERSEEEAMASGIRMHKSLKPLLPEFHTRQMRKDFYSKFVKLPISGNGTVIPPHILRAIYRELTLDASADQNPALDERVRQAILSDDSDLAIDLRHKNCGRPSDTFNTFFEHLAKKIDEMAAVDERRHNVEHMSKYLSIHDLREQVEKELEPGTPIPSESTILYAFVPKNSHTKAAKLYKSRIPLQFKVQTRQLRLSHQDDHYCAAIFKYMREYAIKFRDHTSFLCVDDKAKVDYGEPGMAISTGVRGKKSIVPVGSSLSALDHDMQSKGSITPSVCLKVHIPESIEESFYRGKVYVLYKDSVFMPSSPWRHGCEIAQILQSSEGVPPVLIFYSDGGPDHRVTFHAVKLSLIILFKMLDLDFLVAGRTAPGNSWMNPAERIMSVLNVALQNVALTRDEMNSEMEQVVKSSNSMSEIRKKAEKYPNLKEAWVSSVDPLMMVLKERTERLKLKDVPFSCPDGASSSEVDAFENSVKEKVDATLQLGQYQDKFLSKTAEYMKFLQSHCRQRSYLFQIRKCSDPSCCNPARAGPGFIFPWVPDPIMSNDCDHYEPFANLIGKETTEKDRPSSQNTRTSVVAEQVQGIRNSGLVGQNVRFTVNCYECSKPRCVYSKRSLTVREMRAVNRMLEKHDYSCGCMIIPEDDVLHGVIHTRLQMDCRTPVEFAYYAENTPSKHKKNICCHCARNAERDQNLLKQFKVVLPLCESCKILGKESVKRNPIK